MKKRLLICFILLAFITIGCTKKEEVIKEIPLMEYDQFKDIDISKVQSIDYYWYNEGGREEKIIIDKDRITNIYNNLSKLKVGKETTMACEDNTKVYVFNMSDNKIKIEIECDWLVIGNKHYEVK